MRSLASWVISGNLLKLSGPWVPHLEKAGDNTCPLRFLGGPSNTLQTKRQAQCSGPRCLVKDSPSQPPLPSPSLAALRNEVERAKEGEERRVVGSLGAAARVGPVQMAPDDHSHVAVQEGGIRRSEGQDKGVHRRGHARICPHFRGGGRGWRWAARGRTLTVEEAVDGGRRHEGAQELTQNIHGKLLPGHAA